MVRKEPAVVDLPFAPFTSQLLATLALPLALQTGNSVSAFMRALREPVVVDLQAAADWILLQEATLVSMMQQLLLALPKGNSVSAFMRAPKDNAVEDLQVAADLILLQVASRVPVKQQQLPFHLGCFSNADFIYRSLISFSFL